MAGWDGRWLAHHMEYLQNACMSRSITIRNVPDETGNELAARAATTGRSLQEYLRAQLIDLARRPDPEVFVARLRERKRAAGARLSPEEILEYLDEGRS